MGSGGARLQPSDAARVHILLRSRASMRCRTKVTKLTHPLPDIGCSALTQR